MERLELGVSQNCMLELSVIKFINVQDTGEGSLSPKTCGSCEHRSLVPSAMCRGKGDLNNHGGEIKMH